MRLLDSHVTNFREGVPENLEDLIDFRVTRKEWLSLTSHLGKDGSDRPHIDSS